MHKLFTQGKNTSLIKYLKVSTNELYLALKEKNTCTSRQLSTSTHSNQSVTWKSLKNRRNKKNKSES